MLPPAEVVPTNLGYARTNHRILVNSLNDMHLPKLGDGEEHDGWPISYPN
jgi:hypothetical protein